LTFEEISIFSNYDHHICRSGCPVWFLKGNTFQISAHLMERLWLYWVCSCILNPFSIYSCSIYVGWLAGSYDTLFSQMKNIKIPHVFRIKMIQTNSDWNWPREEEFLNSFKPDEGWWQRFPTFWVRWAIEKEDIIFRAYLSYSDQQLQCSIFFPHIKSSF
jgi:hypothetical protein